MCGSAVVPGEDTGAFSVRLSRGFRDVWKAHPGSRPRARPREAVLSLGPHHFLHPHPPYYIRM